MSPRAASIRCGHGRGTLRSLKTVLRVNDDDDADDDDDIIVVVVVIIIAKL